MHSGLLKERHTAENVPDRAKDRAGGRKVLNPTFWSDHVRCAQKDYVGRAYDDIRAVFFGHELIRSLGCESHIAVGSVVAALAVPALAMLQERL